jgi:hypothetical protein
MIGLYWRERPRARRQKTKHETLGEVTKRICYARRMLSSPLHKDIQQDQHDGKVRAAGNRHIGVHRCLLAEHRATFRLYGSVHGFPARQALE